MFVFLFAKFDSLNYKRILLKAQITKKGFFLFFFFFLSFCYFLGCSCDIWRFPGWGQIGAIAAGLYQSHSNAGSELRLQPTQQPTATPDP